MSAVLEQSEVKLRPMRESDVDAVFAIESQAYPYPWSEGIFRDCLRVGYCCWLLVEGEVGIAYGIMSVGAGESHILNICVRPEYQRRGYGGLLLRHLLQLAKRHHAEVSLLEVRRSNLAALSLYAHLGFKEIGVRTEYYPAPNGREDALVLSKNL